MFEKLPWRTWPSANRVFKRHCPRPRLGKADHLFWVLLCKTWKDWRRALIIVKPETVSSWHRRGFRLSNAGPVGPPKSWVNPASADCIVAIIGKPLPEGLGLFRNSWILKFLLGMTPYRGSFAPKEQT